jgi:hypothetical protein
LLQQRLPCGAQVPSEQHTASGSSQQRFPGQVVWLGWQAAEPLLQADELAPQPPPLQQVAVGGLQVVPSGQQLAPFGKQLPLQQLPLGQWVELQQTPPLTHWPPQQKEGGAQHPLPHGSSPELQVGSGAQSAAELPQVPSLQQAGWSAGQQVPSPQSSAPEGQPQLGSSAAQQVPLLLSGRSDGQQAPAEQTSSEAQ